MIIVYSDTHRRHDPPHEFVDGEFIPYTESPRRAIVLHDALVAAGIGPSIAPEDFGLEPILAVHSADYMDFLRTIYDVWIAEGLTPKAAMASTYPRLGFERESLSPHGLLGRYCFDNSVPITAGTYEASIASANCALTAARLVQNGEDVAYALCRPPGHHAYRDMAGGFCYINNAAVAAQYLVANGAQRVAVLDIDVHHGNGTQAIFYDRADVLFVSLHAGPDWEYPYFAGWPEEKGEGEGYGYNHNFPLPKHTCDGDYLGVLEQALAIIRQYAPEYLVLSAGVDTYEADPISHLGLMTPVFYEIGSRIHDLSVPTVILQEGGYNIEKLGANVIKLLRGFLQP